MVTARGRWWPFSAELLDAFRAMAARGGQPATTLVKLSDGMRRVLRDMGSWTWPPKWPSRTARGPGRLLG